MKRLFLGSTFIAGTLLAAAMFASFAFNTPQRGFEPSAEAAEICTSGSVPFVIQGSTTVGEIIAPHETGANSFESEWGPDLQLSLTGSTAGINALTAGTIDGANSSRALSGAEIVGKYAFSIAFDEFVLVVSTHGDMSVVTDISVSQLAQIYGAGNPGILSLEWQDLSPPIARASFIIPRMRSTASGSRGDFNGQIGVSATAENNTYLALGGDGGSYPRGFTALNMAQFVRNDVSSVNFGIDQISYTSLKDGVDQPPTGIRALTVGGIVASQGTIFSGYPLPRELFIASRDTTLDPRLDGGGVDYSEMVRVDDYINYWRGWDKDLVGEAATGPTGHIANEGMVPRAKGAKPPIPNGDITMTSGTGLGDIGAIIQKWGKGSACNGWIRADANNNASVGLTDIGVVINQWGQPGFVCVSGAVCANP